MVTLGGFGWLTRWLGTVIHLLYGSPNLLAIENYFTHNHGMTDMTPARIQLFTKETPYKSDKS